MKRPYVLLATILFAFATTSIKADVPAEQNTFGGFTPFDFVAPLPKVRTRPIGSVAHFKYETESGISDTYAILHKESLGWYYITAYCPSECGYNGDNYPTGWTTASGEICHRADWEYRYTEPTTCAISRSIHSFGEQFYIEEFDRVFVAEDTGSAVNGKHLDLFYEDYEDVVSFPTGYYEVYSVWVEEVSYYPYGDFMEAIKEDKLC